MTENCTRKLLAAMPNAPSTVKVVTPVEVGMARIGHAGAFRTDAADALWPMFERALLKPGSIDP